VLVKALEVTCTQRCLMSVSSTSACVCGESGPAQPHRAVGWRTLHSGAAMDGVTGSGALDFVRMRASSTSTRTYESKVRPGKPRCLAGAV
jgi:hypothetical protein